MVILTNSCIMIMINHIDEAIWFLLFFESSPKEDIYIYCICYI